MGTFGTIKARVNVIIIDLPTAVSSAVGALVNSAMRKLQLRHNFKVMETSTALTLTTINTRILMAAPSDIKEWRDYPVIQRSLGTIKEIDWANSLNDAKMFYTETDTGEPRILVDSDPTAITGARNVLVYPLPNGLSDYSGGEYRVLIPYMRYLTALSADSDTNWFTTAAEDYIVYKAAALGFAMDWDTEHQAVWESMAEIEYKEVVLGDKKMRLSNVGTLVPHWEGARSARLRGR